MLWRSINVSIVRKMWADRVSLLRLLGLFLILVLVCLCFKCAQQVGIDYQSVQTCANGPLGQQIILDTMAYVKSLQPPLELIPYLILNGVNTLFKQIQFCRCRRLFSFIYTLIYYPTSQLELANNVLQHVRKYAQYACSTLREFLAAKNDVKSKPHFNIFCDTHRPHQPWILQINDANRFWNFDEVRDEFSGPLELSSSWVTSFL